MKIVFYLSLTLMILLFIFADPISAQLKGSLKYERLPSELERAPTENPCVRIKSQRTDLRFDWSGGPLDTHVVSGDWIITLRPGLQILTVYAPDFESVDITLNLRKYEVHTYRIIPDIKQFNLKIETEPDTAIIIFKDKNSDMTVRKRAPFEYSPQPGEYELNISCFDYEPMDTLIIIDNDPIIELKFKLKEKSIVEAEIKLPKIAVQVIEGQSPFDLKDTEITKIRNHIRSHYKKNNEVFLLSENQSKDLFKKIKSRGDIIKVMHEEKVEFIVDCESALMTFNQREPDSSIIQINMTLNILKKNIFNKKNIERNFIDIADRQGYYFPNKIDTALYIYDDIIHSHIENRITKCDVIMGIITLVAWRVLDAMFKPEERKKLPDVPDFPKPK